MPACQHRRRLPLGKHMSSIPILLSKAICRGDQFSALATSSARISFKAAARRRGKPAVSPSDSRQDRWCRGFSGTGTENKPRHLETGAETGSK